MTTPPHDERASDGQRQAAEALARQCYESLGSDHRGSSDRLEQWANWIESFARAERARALEEAAMEFDDEQPNDHVAGIQLNNEDTAIRLGAEIARRLRARAEALRKGGWRAEVMARIERGHQIDRILGWIVTAVFLAVLVAFAWVRGCSL